MITDLDIDLSDDDIKCVEPCLVAVFATAVVSLLYYVLQSKLGPEL
jgi:hypothetical protein